MIVRYADAEHGFHCDARPAVFNADDAADAHQRTLAFFASSHGESLNHDHSTNPRHFGWFRPWSRPASAGLGKMLLDALELTGAARPRVCFARDR